MLLLAALLVVSYFASNALLCDAMRAGDWLAAAVYAIINIGLWLLAGAAICATRKVQ